MEESSSEQWPRRPQQPPQSQLELELIYGQLNKIQKYQEEALRQKDVELEQLRSQLEQQKRELAVKALEIRQLERERHRQQEERALELGTLVRRGAATAGAGANSQHYHHANPYHESQQYSDDLCSCLALMLSGGLCTTSSSTYSSSLHGHRSNLRHPPRWMDRLFGITLIFLLVHFYHLSQMQPPFRQYDDVAYHNHHQAITSSDSRPTTITSKTMAFSTEPIKPWDSKPPKPIALMSVNDPKIQRRHQCIQAVRKRQQEIFQSILLLGNKSNIINSSPSTSTPLLDVLLVDPAYHANVGDHMLTVGELHLIQHSLDLPAPNQCYYIQAGGFYESCTEIIRRSGSNSPKDTEKVAMWHAGGNWGDLWRDAQDVRIPSIKTILENGYQLIGLPQSLFYLDESLKGMDATAIKEKVALGLNLAEEQEHDPSNWRRQRRRLSEFGWEENSEFNLDEDDADEEDFQNWGDFLAYDAPVAVKPVNTSALDSPEGLALAKSRAIFMWREKESFEEATRLYPFVTNMVVPDMAFQLGPYAPIRKHPKELVDFVIFLRNDKESKVHAQRNDDSIRNLLPRKDMTFKIVDWPDRLHIFGTMDYFFTDTSIQLLSLGKVVICDRLHAAILSYLAGLPFVYIDQVSGKVTKTLTAAFDETEGCMDGEQALWARAMSLEEAVVKATDMIDKHGLNHAQPSFLRGLINFGSNP